MNLVQKSRAINDLIIVELIKGEAEKRQIAVTDEELDKAISDITQNMGGEEKLKDSLKQNNIDNDTFRKTIKFDILRNKLVESVIGKGKPSDAEIKKFYDANQDKFKHSDEVRASHILISASESDIRSKIKDEQPNLSEPEVDKLVAKEVDAAKQKAQKLYMELQANPSKFAEYAHNYSEDPSSAAKGGDLGFFGQGEMVPEFSQAAFATKPGKMAELVKSEFGFHIIKVTDRKTAGVTSLDEVKPQIERYLDGKKKMEALQGILEQAKQTAKIEFVNTDFDPQNIRKEYKALIEQLRSAEVGGTSPVNNPKAPSAEAAKPADAKKL
jgi:parvulin-like peptidyl-prolyl isomerase